MIFFRKAILLIHGYAGGTYDMEPLANYLERNSKFDVYSFTLPGHQKRLFKSEKYADWIDASEEMLKKVKSYGYKDIYIVGHSMGGVIASYLASKYSYVKKLVLASPAFRYIINEDDAGTFSLLKGSFGVAVKADKEELVTRFLKLPISSVNEFKKLVSEYKKFIEDVNIPVLIVHGNEDELVPYASSYDLIDKIKSKNKKLYIVDKATHDVFKCSNSQKCIEEIERFFK